MTRVVLGTNVLVSAVRAERGALAMIREGWLTGRFQGMCRSRCWQKWNARSPSHMSSRDSARTEPSASSRCSNGPRCSGRLPSGWWGWRPMRRTSGFWPGTPAPTSSFWSPATSPCNPWNPVTRPGVLIQQASRTSSTPRGRGARPTRSAKASAVAPRPLGRELPSGLGRRQSMLPAVRLGSMMTPNGPAPSREAFCHRTVTVFRARRTTLPVSRLDTRAPIVVIAPCDSH